jgi:putative DNA primase/helicase
MDVENNYLPLEVGVDKNAAPHPRFDNKGTVTGMVKHIENYKWMFDQYGINIKYNVITKDVEIDVPGKSFRLDNRSINYYVELTSICEINKISSDGMTDIIIAIANQNSYNPVKDWVTAATWDGVDRIKDVCECLTVEAGMENWRNIALRKWMIGAYWMSTNDDGDRYMKGTLVLQGEQSIGKTPFFNSLLGEMSQFFDDGIELDPSDKDSKSEALSNWIVELGEIDSTMSKAHAGSLKAWLSKRDDKLRLPYAKSSSNWPRRTVFCASVNPDEFLVDTTGNDRFWTLAVKSIDFKTLNAIDKHQLWSQVRHEVIELVRNDSYTYPWVLDKEQMKIMREVNERFVQLVSVEQSVIDMFNTKKGEEPLWQGTLTAMISLIGYGSKKLNKSERASLKDRLAKMFGKTKYQGVTGYAIPHPDLFSEQEMKMMGFIRRNPSVSIIEMQKNRSGYNDVQGLDTSEINF